MTKSPFIWLGSGRARRRNVARKGRLLDQAARSGLPVPPGGILLDEFYRICLAKGLVEVAGQAVIVPDPVWLHEVLFRDVRFPRLENTVAIRPAAGRGANDAIEKERVRMAVDLDDPQQLAEALRAVWSMMLVDDKAQRCDLLLMEMVAVAVAGKAVTEEQTERDQIQLLGRDRDAAFAMDKIHTFQRATAELPAYARRLQKLLRGFRRSFGKGDWRFDWADDGHICWLLQIY